MPTTISGVHFARSFITPAAATAVEREIDFQLGARQGIAIHYVLGHMSVLSFTETTDFQEFNGNHTLHLETGSLETVPDAAGEDEDTIDSEVFFRQDLSVIAAEEAATRGGSAAAMLVVPQAPIPYPSPVFTARNITHRAITAGTALGLGCGVLIFYNYVEFSLSELGVLLARRA